MKNNVYQGKYDDNDFAVLLNSETFNPAPSLKVRNHSPDGFSWSYNGSGPAQLALAILLEETDNEDLALHYYQQYKSEIIANLPAYQGWELNSTKVNLWLDDQEKSQHITVTVGQTFSIEKFAYDTYHNFRDRIAKKISECKEFKVLNTDDEDLKDEIIVVQEETTEQIVRQRYPKANLYIWGDTWYVVDVDSKRILGCGTTQQEAWENVC